MKPILMTAAISLLTTLGMTAQTAAPKGGNLTLRCAGPYGNACTAQHVKSLAAAAHSVTSGPRISLAQVKTISVAADGRLTCKQNNGDRCTAEQAKSLYEIGRAINITVTFSDSQ